MRREDHDFLVKAAYNGDICFCINIIGSRKHKMGLTSETTREMHLQAWHDLANRVRSNIPEADKYLLYVYQDIIHNEECLHFKIKISVLRSKNSG